MKPILALILAALGTGFAIVFLQRLSPALGLIDQPGGRKEHDLPVPLVGGLAIFVAFVGAAIALGLGISTAYFLIAITVITGVGLLDDMNEIKPIPKFAAQISASLIMIFGAGVQLVTVGNLIGLGYVGLSVLSIPLTLFAVVGVINALNMFDGIDGLAGLVSLIAVIAYASVAALTAPPPSPAQRTRAPSVRRSSLRALIPTHIPKLLQLLALLGRNRRLARLTDLPSLRRQLERTRLPRKLLRRPRLSLDEVLALSRIVLDIEQLASRKPARVPRVRLDPLPALRAHRAQHVALVILLREHQLIARRARRGPSC